MQRLTLASLAAAILASGALPAAARDPGQGAAVCDERRFAPDAPTLRIGRTIGSGAILGYFEGDRQGCPETPSACLGTASIMPGAALLLDAARADHVCAIFADGQEARAGWLPRRRIAPAARPVDPAPPLAAWVGTWRQYDNNIVLTREGGRIAAAGEAYWPAKNIMPANEGAFAGAAAPSGRRLQIADAPCEVEMTLAGDFLFVADNRMCGGHNASFLGIFVRRTDASK
ncbi:MAG TPA: hypothetical protein VM755_20370 [Stellaceae bacterium]|nr:hypothetical protein [Stellaceae bacterium]